MSLFFLGNVLLGGTVPTGRLEVAPSRAPKTVMVSLQKATLSLEEALSIAEKNSLNVKVAETNVERNRLRIREGFAALGPSLTINGLYQRFGNDQTGNIGGQNITFVPFDQYFVTGVLNWQLDIMGNAQRALVSLRANLAASESGTSAALNDVRLAVRRAFLGVLRAKALVRVSETGLGNVTARVEQAEKQFDAGVIAKNDLDRLKAQREASLSDLVSARNTLQIAKQALNLSMTRPVDTEVDVDDMAETTPVAVQIDEIEMAAMERRPEVKQLVKSIDSLKEIEKITKRTLQPSLNLSLNYQNNLQPVGFNPQREIVTTNLQLSIPIWDGKATEARVAQSHQDVVAAEANLAQIKLGISQEVRTALVNYRTAGARLTNANRQLELAKEVARLARIRRDVGEATVLEVVDAETTLVQAETAVVNAKYDILTAYAELQRGLAGEDVEKAVSEAKLLIETRKKLEEDLRNKGSRAKNLKKEKENKG